MRRAGRPKTSPLTRVEQLREAKRAQRQRDRQRGLDAVQVKLSADRARKLRVATNAAHFEAALDRFLDEMVVDIRRWPVLRELAWNRVDELIPADQALGLYERNWRFVDPARMSAEEQAFLARLKTRLGRDAPGE